MIVLWMDFGFWLVIVVVCVWLCVVLLCLVWVILVFLFVVVFVGGDILD